jgi:hypothetical protein
MRQKVLLGILAAVLLIVGWIYLVPGGDDDAPVRGTGRASGGVDPDSGVASAPARAAAGVVSAGNPGAASGQTVQTVDTLHLDALGRTPPSFRTGRDPWRFVEPPPPPPPAPHKPSAAELRAQQEAAEAARRLAEEQARRAAEEAARPKPPPFTWSYLGNFGPPQQRIAVFTDGQRVWNARQGDTLENKFIVAQIGYESVDIGFVGFPQVQPLRLAVKH